MKNTRIADIVRVMKKVSQEKTYNNQPWSAAECKFYYMIVCETIKECLLENGSFAIPGFAAFELKYRNPKRQFNRQTQEFEEGKEYTYLSVKSRQEYKRRIKALDTHFVKEGEIDGSSEE